MCALSYNLHRLVWCTYYEHATGILCKHTYLQNTVIPVTIPTHVHTALYLLYAKLEEDHGLARHAMAVYDILCLFHSFF